jgi:dolichol kinase
MATQRESVAGAQNSPASTGWVALERQELRRRFWHIAPGLLPLGLWFFPHRDPLSPILQTILALVVTGFGLNAFIRYRKIARAEDRQKLASVLGYTGGIFVPLVLFPGDVEIALSFLTLIAFGDGFATLGGMLIGGARLPWNAQKTWSGFACFLLAGVPMTSLVYWGEIAFNPESQPDRLPFGTCLLVAGSGVLAAALAESLPSRVNDNIRIAVAGVATMALMHGWLVGWTV